MNTAPIKQLPNHFKVNITLDRAKEITYLTREYYDAMQKDHPLPKAKLPTLRQMLLSNTIVGAYLAKANMGLSIKLVSSCLPAEVVAAVYLFYNEPTLNVKIGKYQMFVVKHPSFKN